MDGGRLSLELIYTQLMDDIGPAPLGANTRCVLVEEWQLIKGNDGITIAGAWEDSVHPSRPEWIEFSEDSGHFQLTIPYPTHLLSTISLLFEVWSTREDDSSRTLTDILHESLGNLARRWSSGGDPIGVERQMGLIGEIVAVRDATDIVGEIAIDSWDPDSRALFDITSEQWVIEAKATRSDPEAVWISNPYQVDYTIDKPIILAVTRMNLSDEGRTMPEIIDYLISSMSPEHQSKVKILLATQGYVEELRNRFRNKWEIHGTRYISITNDSPVMPCSILSDIPQQVSKISYRLSSSEMEDSELSDLI